MKAHQPSTTAGTVRTAVVLGADFFANPARSIGLSILSAALLVGVFGAGFLVSKKLAPHSTGRPFVMMMETVEQEILSKVRAKTFIAISEEKLVGKTDLVLAKITRQESLLRTIERTVRFIGLKSTALVQISYSVDYAFGFDLSKGSFEVRAVDDVLEIWVTKPRQIMRPALFDVVHTVHTDGYLIKEEQALIEMNEQLASQAWAKGNSMLSAPEVLALCEKNLTEFLASALRPYAKEQGLPRMVVMYREPVPTQDVGERIN